MADLTIAVEPRKILTVDLGGTEYKVTPPKAALGLKLAVRGRNANDNPDLMMEALDEWMDKAFTKRVANTIRRRIEDETDDLDVTHVMQLMELVIEHTAGRPTS
jgi:hypothetical protein